MFKSGYYTIGLFRGAPVRIHWSAPLGALFFGGFAFRPGFWVAFLLLILLHEFGHAIVVRMTKQHVAGIDILPFGGLCKWGGFVTPIQRACIAWGGVWAQLALFLVMQVVLLFWQPSSALAWDIVQVFTRVNLWLAALNLIPIRPLDGAEAWPLFRLLWERHKIQKQIEFRPEEREKKKKNEPPEDPKYSDRVQDPNKSEQLFNRLMNNSPVEEEDQER